MSTVRRVAKNTLVWFFGDIVGKILSLAFIIYAARYLHAEGYGILSFALAFTGMFGILSDIGFYELIVREVARDKKLINKYVENIATIKVIIVVAVYGLMCLVINLMGYPTQTIVVVYILGLSIVFDAFAMIFNATFQAFERMEYISLGKILKNSMLLFGALLIISKGLGLVSFAVLYLIASLTLLIYNIIISIRNFTRPPRLRVDLKFWRWLIKEGVTFWATGVFAVLLNNVDKVMLSVMVGDTTVGLYSAAYRLVSTLDFIPLAFIASIFPVTSRLFVSSRQSLKFAFERSFKYLLIVGVLIGSIFTILSDRLIFLIYGEDYIPSANALRVLIWSEVFLFINMVFGNLFKSINRQVVVTYAVAVATTLNVTMNWLLIPKYSFIGASLATVLARFLIFLLFFILVMKSEYRMSNESLVNILKVLFALLMVSAFIWVLKGTGTTDSILIATLSLLVYALIIVALRLIDSTDMQLIKGLIKS